MTVDPYDPMPLYRQLAAILREQIKSGELEPREMLPSEKTLQQEHGIARGSVRRAVEILREEGWVVTLPQRGTYVTPPENWPDTG